MCSSFVFANNVRLVLQLGQQNILLVSRLFSHPGKHNNVSAIMLLSLARPLVCLAGVEREGKGKRRVPFDSYLPHLRPATQARALSMPQSSTVLPTHMLFFSD